MRKYLAAAFVFLAACVFAALPAKPRGFMAGLSAGGGGVNAYTFLAAQSCGFTSGSSGCTSPAINTTGATLLAAVVTGITSSPGLTDSASNTWSGGTLIGVIPDYVTIYYKLNPATSASHTFTLGSGSATFSALAVAAFSGGPQKTFDALSVGATGASSSPSGGSITPAQNNEIVIAGVENHSGGTTINSLNGGFTIPANGNFAAIANQNAGAAIAYLIQTTAGAANPTWTLSASDTWVAVNAAFK